MNDLIAFTNINKDLLELCYKIANKFIERRNR